MAPDGLDQVQNAMQALGGGGASGLDLLSAPQSQPLPGQAGTPEQAAAMQKKGMDLMSAVMPMLSNPALTKGMPPEQAKQMQTMMKFLSAAQDNMKSGKPMSARQQAEMQQALGSMMRGMGQMVPGAPPPGAPAAPPTRSAGSASGAPVEGQR